MPDPISALVSVGTTIIGGKMQGDAAEDAAAVQAGSAEAGIAEARAAREQMRQLLMPYYQAGIPAMQQQQAFLGLQGPGAEQTAIAGVQNSPTMQAMMQQGENAILQNASATGGLRGGNVQGALAQFRPQLLAQEIENRYARLGGFTSLGQNAAAGVGNAGMQTGQNIGNLLQQQGAALAGGQVAQGQMFGNMAGAVNQGLGMWAGMGKKFPWQQSGGIAGGGAGAIPWDLGF
jgi:hypothetical protein